MPTVLLLAAPVALAGLAGYARGVAATWRGSVSVVRRALGPPA